MRVKAEVKEVESANAYCRDCFADERAIMSYDGARELAKLPRGVKALKLSVSSKSGGNVYLCLLHAECLAENIMKQI
jgi:hypothetical protein